MRYACLLALVMLGVSSWRVAASENPLTPTDIGAPGCQTPPLQESDLRQITPTTERDWIPTALPEGDPAPAKVREEFAKTVQEVFECLMTGDPWRTSANYSQAYIAERLFAFRSDLSAPAPTHDQEVDVSGFYEGPWRILVLPDGRVAALL
jgi:hypothetical protein